MALLFFPSAEANLDDARSVAMQVRLQIVDGSVATYGSARGVGKRRREGVGAR